MTSYDLNATYGTLRVYNQRSEGTCWQHAMGLCVAAQILMHTGVQPGWADNGESYPRFTSVGFQPDGSYIDYETFFQDGVRHTLTHEVPTRDMSQANLTRLLDLSHVATLGLNINASFAAPPQAPGLPIIAPVPQDQPSDRGHDTVAVGYTSAGVIIQNSYGTAWGYRGRAVLSWEWLAANGGELERVQVDDYPIDGATKVPRPVEEPMILLAQRTPASPIFAFLGGARSWVPNRTVLPTQGLSMMDVKVVPDTDPIWTLPMVGTKPPSDT